MSSFTALATLQITSACRFQDSELAPRAKQVSPTVKSVPRVIVMIDVGCCSFRLAIGAAPLSELKGDKSPPPLELQKPNPTERMTAYEISTKINKPGYDAPDILDPVPPAAGAGGPATPQLRS